ncbi:hypothetical protein JR316_0005739 [Psilocybe cubensis]|uniref:Uncharacterized protein n=1 Tax=Psilocybe cubensis TaxID=181762 RepID=A0ACB8GZP1_PSICU|nr:hypothetical protein JR316_0005739 [Psilocybe cubensis]KAH9481218.1 hypothetical protein JR316_0005739 [Psilocybe cubensis]
MSSLHAPLSGSGRPTSNGMGGSNALSGGSDRDRIERDRERHAVAASSPRLGSTVVHPPPSNADHPADQPWPVDSIDTWNSQSAEIFDIGAGITTSGNNLGQHIYAQIQSRAVSASDPADIEEDGELDWLAKSFQSVVPNDHNMQDLDTGDKGRGSSSERTVSESSFSASSYEVGLVHSEPTTPTSYTAAVALTLYEFDYRTAQTAMRPVISLDLDEHAISIPSSSTPGFIHAAEVRSSGPISQCSPVISFTSNRFSTEAQYRCVSDVYIDGNQVYSMPAHLQLCSASSDGMIVYKMELGNDVWAILTRDSDVHSSYTMTQNIFTVSTGTIHDEIPVFSISYKCVEHEMLLRLQDADEARQYLHGNVYFNRNPKKVYIGCELIPGKPGTSCFGLRFGMNSCSQVMRRCEGKVNDGLLQAVITLSLQTNSNRPLRIYADSSQFTSLMTVSAGGQSSGIGQGKTENFCARHALFSGVTLQHIMLGRLYHNNMLFQETLYHNTMVFQETLSYKLLIR